MHLVLQVISLLFNGATLYAKFIEHQLLESFHQDTSIQFKLMKIFSYNVLQLWTTSDRLNTRFTPVVNY